MFDFITDHSDKIKRIFHGVFCTLLALGGAALLAITHPGLF